MPSSCIGRLAGNCRTRRRRRNFSCRDSARTAPSSTTPGLVALRALGVKPRFDPLPVFAVVLKEDYKKLPPYMTSFFPLAYLASGQKIPAEADRKIRGLMAQAQGSDGYL